MAVNKVVYGNTPIMDITDTTAEQSDVMEGKYFYDKSGTRVAGTATVGVTDVEVDGVSVVDEDGVAGIDLSGKANTSHTHITSDITDFPTIPTKTSELDNDSGYITGMYIAAYGKSTYAEVLAAYRLSKVVYCRCGTGTNPASGNQLRLAFLAYVNNEATPTEFEFQYYRSVSSHTDSQQGDQVYVYKLNKTNGWSVTVRSAFTKIVAGSGLTSSYSNGVLTISLAT